MLELKQQIDQISDERDLAIEQYEQHIKDLQQTNQHNISVADGVQQASDQQVKLLKE